MNEHENGEIVHYNSVYTCVSQNFVILLFCLFITGKYVYHLADLPGSLFFDYDNVFQCNKHTHTHIKNCHLNKQ